MIDAAKSPLQREMSSTVKDKARKPTEGRVAAAAGIVRVFSPSAMSKSVGRDEDAQRRICAAIEELTTIGFYRPLRRPADGWAEQLRQLALEQPNFEAVIREVVHPHVHMTDRGVRHRMQPILLVSPPGSGKTRFARSLGEILSVPTLFVDLASETNGSALTGSSTFWSNSSPGRLFDLLAWDSISTTAVANPIVVLDEIDKAVVFDRFSPLAGLHSLLESDTSAIFEDQSVPGMTIDASNVRFILTANDADCLPAQIRSRLLIFHIHEVSEDQAQQAVQRMFVEICHRLSLRLSFKLSPELLHELASMSFRKAKILLETSAVMAEAAGQQELRSIVSTSVPIKYRKMGFV